MALIDASLIMDTVRGWVIDQAPVYNTVINYYFIGRQITTFFGRRSVILTANLPSLEVAVTSENESWAFCRVLNEKTALEIDITVDHTEPEQANRCLNSLVNLTTRLLSSPPHLRGNIAGTPHYLNNSIPDGVTYQLTSDGLQRYATITWSGERLDHLVNSLFDTSIQVPTPIIFPPN